jgi:hypothetical protein
MRGRVVGADVRLGLHDPPRPAHPGVQVDERFPQQLARNDQRRPGVKRSRQAVLAASLLVCCVVHLGGLQWF